ncbi:MAG: NADH-quinone oxidoreductase subunit L, partial [Myxococcota bacterium]
MTMDGQYYLGLIVLMPLLGALLNGIFGAKLPRVAVNLIAIGAILLSFFFSLASIHVLVRSAQARGEHVEYLTQTYVAYEWIYAGDLHVDIAFMLDPLTALMLLLITGVGFLIHLYSAGYMEDDPGIWRYMAYLNLFCFSMLLLVMGKNMLVTFIGWEGVGLCSYLLIGFWYEDDEKAMAGQKAFTVNRVGDFAFLVGLFILFYEAGTLDYAEIAQLATSRAGLESLAPVSAVAMILVFIGCTGKSAQIPLYTWLPDAMAGPTPVSALIHAATMVTAGVFLLSRMNWLVTIMPETMMVIAWVGALTAFFAATIAIVQNDIKKVLAYSTVSQLGYMFLAVGVGSFTGAVFHLMTHAFFKALLFLGSGSVIHAVHDQDIRNMGGLRKYMPWTAGTFFVGCLAIAGVPLCSGFFSKDLILWSAFSNVHIFMLDGVLGTSQAIDYLVNMKAPQLSAGDGHEALNVLLAAQITSKGTYALGLVTAFMTAFYMFRLYFVTFEGEFRGEDDTREHLHESPETMVIPLAVLGVLAFAGGLTGWPHFLVHWVHLPEGFFLFFEHWFHQVFEVSSTYRIHSMYGAHAYGLEAIITAVSVVAGLAGIGLAYNFYVLHPEQPAKIKESAEQL